MKLGDENVNFDKKHGMIRGEVFIFKMEIRESE